MIWRNNIDAFGAVAKAFHWAVALLIVANLGLGITMMNLMGKGPAQFHLIGVHKSIGICVLALGTLRLLWRSGNVRPRRLLNHRRWEIVLAKLVHFLLYVAMLTLPLSGWLFSSAHGYAVSVFGWFTLPDLVPKNHALGEALETYHNLCAWTLLAVLGLHAAGALKHHVIDRDNTLRRMLPGGRTASLLGLAAAEAVIVALIVIAGTTPPPISVHGVDTVSPSYKAAVENAAQEQESRTIYNSATAQQWQIDPAQSHLTFDDTQNGAPFSGTFKSFGGTINFDPANLGGSRVAITIPLQGITTGSDDRDQNIAAPDWLNAAAFPQATYTADSFEAKGGDNFIAHGKLTLRGVSAPVDLVFTVIFDKDGQGHRTAKMQGTATFSRLAFGVGGGEWADPKSVGDAVTVHVAVTAMASGP